MLMSLADEIGMVKVSTFKQWVETRFLPNHHSGLADYKIIVIQ
jgi:hypothetical protein